MYNALLHAHSGLRWIALLLLIVAIANAAKSQASGQYLKKDKMINLFAMVILHIQLLIGLALYFVNSPKVNFSAGWMKVEMYRFYGLEHLVGMLLAITVITLGRSKAEKKLKNTRDKHRRVMISYTIGLILILLSIPWPFRAALGGAWA